MARVRCPLNVSSITLSVSGVLAPDSAGIITCTSSEATALAANGFTHYNSGMGCANLVDTDASGNINIAVPTVITALTIAGTGYTVTGTVVPFGRCLNTRVPAIPASQFLYQNFGLVNG